MSYHITKRVIRIYVMQHYIISYHPLHILAFYLQKVQIFHLPDSNYLRLTEILEYKFHFKGQIRMAVLVITRFFQFHHQLFVRVNPPAQKLQGGSYAYTGIVKHGKVGFGISADRDFFI